jgi:hypothetical protein
MGKIIEPDPGIIVPRSELNYLKNCNYCKKRTKHNPEPETTSYEARALEP